MSLPGADTAFKESGGRFNTYSGRQEAWIIPHPDPWKIFSFVKSNFLPFETFHSPSCAMQVSLFNGFFKASLVFLAGLDTYL